MRAPDQFRRVFFTTPAVYDFEGTPNIAAANFLTASASSRGFRDGSNKPAQSAYCFSRKNTVPVGGELVALLLTTTPR